MKRDKYNEWRGMSAADLESEVDRLKLEQYKLREKMVVEEVTNSQEKTVLRRDIAQLKTILREKALAENPKPENRRGRRTRRQRQAARSAR